VRFTAGKSRPYGDSEYDRLEDWLMADNDVEGFGEIMKETSSRGAKVPFEGS
jgi:hypothetical protein